MNLNVQTKNFYIDFIFGQYFSILSTCDVDVVVTCNQRGMGSLLFLPNQKWKGCGCYECPKSLLTHSEMDQKCLNLY